MTIEQTNSGANRTEDAELPPNQASDESAESKKKKKNNNNSNSNNSQVTHLGLIKDGVMKDIIILSGMPAQMTTDYRLFMTTLISHFVSKGYKRWPGVLENMEVLKDNVRKTTRPDKNKYAQILEIDVTGTDKNIIIKKQE